MPFFTIGNIGLSHAAGGSADRLLYQTHEHREIGRLLTLQGFVFDHLVWTSDLLKAENFALNPDRWDGKLRLSKQPYIEVLWSQIPPDLKKHRDSTEPLEYARYDDNFSFTLVKGHNNRRFMKPQEHRKRFKAYLKALQCYSPLKNILALLHYQMRFVTKLILGIVVTGE